MVVVDEVRSWLADRGYKVLRIEPLHGSRVCRLYVIDVNAQLHSTFVYKSVPSATRPDLQWLRPHHSLLIPFMPALHLVVQDGPDQVSLSDDGGQDLSKLFDERPPLERERLCTDAARLLARLHTTFHRSNPVTSRPREVDAVLEHAPLYPISHVQEWAIDAAQAILRFTDRQGIPQPNERSPLPELANTFYETFAQTLTDPVTLTHGDPHLGNFVQHSSGLRLVDWEYACAAPPERDLAVLMQSIPDPKTRSVVFNTYQACALECPLAETLTISSRVLNAALFDNTLMMLGWEIDQVEQRTGTSSVEDHALRRLIDVAQWKLDLIYDAYAQLTANERPLMPPLC